MRHVVHGKRLNARQCLMQWPYSQNRCSATLLPTEGGVNKDFCLFVAPMAAKMAPLQKYIKSQNLSLKKKNKKTIFEPHRCCAPPYKKKCAEAVFLGAGRLRHAATHLIVCNRCRNRLDGELRPWARWTRQRATDRNNFYWNNWSNYLFRTLEAQVNTMQ